MVHTIKRNVENTPMNYLMKLCLNLNKALEMHIRGGELACGNGYKNAGDAYHIGRGVRIDNKKAMQYYVLAPIKGDVHARHNIACMEGIAGNNK